MISKTMVLRDSGSKKRSAVQILRVGRGRLSLRSARFAPISASHVLPAPTGNGLFFGWAIPGQGRSKNPPQVGGAGGE